MSDILFITVFLFVLILSELLGQIFFRIAILPHKLQIQSHGNRIDILFWPFNIGNVRLFCLGILALLASIFLIVTGNHQKSLADMLFPFLVLGAFSVFTFVSAYNAYYHRILLQVTQSYIEVFELNKDGIVAKSQVPYVPRKINYQRRYGTKLGPFFLYPLLITGVDHAEIAFIKNVDIEEIANSIKQTIETHLKLSVSIPTSN